MATSGSKRPRKAGSGKRGKSSKAGSGNASKRKASSAAADDELDLGSDKLYFKIGEVSEIVGVPPYVLRYWETEFKAIRPQKSRSQQRVYRRRDVETLLKIKHLLYDEKFTIAGARKRLREADDDCETAPPSNTYLLQQSFARAKSLLEEAMAMVAEDGLDEAAADPAAYLRARGGARRLLDGSSEAPGASQPLLARPQRSPR